MERITIGQHDYVIGKLDAFSQLHVSRRITPIIPTLTPLLTEIAKGGIQDIVNQLEAAKTDLANSDEADSKVSVLGDLDLSGLANAAQPFTEALATMSDENMDYVVHKCLGVVKRANGSSLANVCVNSTIMFDDLELGEILPLVLAVLRVSLGNFIKGLATKAATASLPK